MEQPNFKKMTSYFNPEDDFISLKLQEGLLVLLHIT